MLADGKTAAVSNYGTREEPGRTLTLIDLEKRAPIATIELPEGARPHGLKALSDGRLLVTAEGLKELLIVEPKARRVAARVPTAGEISHMVAASGRRQAGVRRQHRLRIRDGRGPGRGEENQGHPDGRRRRGDRHHAGRPGGLGRQPRGGHGLDRGHEDARGRRDGQGRRSSPSASRSRRTASAPSSPAPVGRRRGHRHRLAKKEIKRISIDREAVPGSESRLFSTQFGKSPTPVGLLIAPDGKRAWVASTNADVVSVLDLVSLTVVGRITAGKEPDGLAGTFGRSLSPGEGRGEGADQAVTSLPSHARLPRRLPRAPSPGCSSSTRRAPGTTSSAVPARRMERLDLHRHDLSLLSLHRRRFDGLLLLPPPVGGAPARKLSFTLSGAAAIIFGLGLAPQHPLLLPVPPGAGSDPGRPSENRRLFLLRGADLSALWPAGAPARGGGSARGVLGADDVRPGAGLRHGAAGCRRQSRGLSGPRRPRRPHLEAQPRLGPGGPAVEPPAIATTLFGFFAGEWLRLPRRLGTQARRTHGRRRDRLLARAPLERLLPDQQEPVDVLLLAPHVGSRRHVPRALYLDRGHQGVESLGEAASSGSA